jgi:hypothetical protein
MSLSIRTTKTASPRPMPPAEQLGFGKHFSDHMLCVDYDAEHGWHDARVEPYAPLALDPSASVLHYGQAMFEGLKAFRGADGKLRLFRLEAHAKRMDARRLAAVHADAHRRSRSSRPCEALVRRRRRLGPKSEVDRAVRAPDAHRDRGLPRRATRQQVPLLHHRLARGQLLRRRQRSSPCASGSRPTMCAPREVASGQREGRRELRREPVRRSQGEEGRLRSGALARRQGARARRGGRHHEPVRGTSTAPSSPRRCRTAFSRA